VILNDGELDGVRMVTPETVRLMKDDQMLGGTVPPLETQVDVSHRVDHLWDRTAMTHSAMGLRTENDVPGMRAGGSLWWAGFLNTWWWVDPKNDVAGVLFTQLLPFCDPGFVRTWNDFEIAVYNNLDLGTPPTLAHKDLASRAAS
jgi:methyl acetate hydrolase